MNCLKGALGVFLLLLAGPAGAFSPGEPALQVTVVDASHLPIPGVHLDLHLGPLIAASAETDIHGRAEFHNLGPAKYLLTATRDGLETLERANVDVTPGTGASIELTMTPALHHENVDVEESITPVEQGASMPTRLPPDAVKELPTRPATVAEALPLVPGVVRKQDGGLQISGSAEHRSSLIVNSADVTDPATGQFGLTVPIDSVETLNVYQTPYMAEYGRFTAGLVSVETRRGGEKWNWELNDPFPDFYIRSWHMDGLRDATPRLNLEGPVIPGKLYFSEGVEYEFRKTEIYTLPFSEQKKTEGVNSFAQLDWVLSDKHMLTGTVHLAPQHLDNINLDYFDPISTVPDASTKNYTETLNDRYSLAGGLLDNTLSVTRFDADVWGHGSDPLEIMPQVRAGNYFANQNRQATRLSWLPIFTFGQWKGWGSHDFKIGSYIARSSDSGEMFEHEIDIRNASALLLESITFVGGKPYSMDDTEYAFFGQDHWILSPRLAVDLGVRTESQEVTASFRMAPRVGVAWTPLASTGTVIRFGSGIFFDHVPLNVYAFNLYPREWQTFYGPDGAIVAGPYYFGNALSEVNVKVPFVFRHQGPGNFSPMSINGSLDLEQPLTKFVKLRLAYIESQANGLVLMEQQPPDPANNVGANTLSGSGASRYRQFEVTTRLRLGGNRQLFFSYVRSRSRGDLNDFNNYLGSFPLAVLRPNVSGNLPGDLPNRFVAWGLLQVPHGFRIAPTAEIRNGFPYYTLDALQNYVGVPNRNRYPSFFSLDARVSKDFKVSPKYSLRPSVSGFNLSDHFNPEAFHNNVGDPVFGVFFGERRRRLTADFDVIF
jgi:hypothetical protein